MNVFPEVNYRHIIIPREKLTPSFIFNELAMDILINDGLKDGEYYGKMGPDKEMIQVVHDISKESKRIINAD